MNLPSSNKKWNQYDEELKTKSDTDQTPQDTL